MTKSIPYLITVSLTTFLLIVGSQFAFSQNGDNPNRDLSFETILANAEAAAKKKFQEATEKTPADQPAPTPGVLGGSGAAGFATPNSPTLSPIQTPLQAVPPQPRANPQNPFAETRQNQWTDKARNNPWARPTPPPVGSPVQPPLSTPATPPPSNIYLPPSTPPPVANP